MKSPSTKPFIETQLQITTAKIKKKVSDADHFGLSS